VPYITILTDPTVGGVMASFAASADVIFAEPGATVGFAGARVISQATHEEFPEGFQTSEFMRDHGFIDLVVPRPEMREQVSRLLGLYPTPRAAFTALAEEA
jgi:acetyl-CoA carboxylase carboxyl transferase subunit beta